MKNVFMRVGVAVVFALFLAGFFLGYFADGDRASTTTFTVLRTTTLTQTLPTTVSYTVREMVTTTATAATTVYGTPLVGGKHVDVVARVFRVVDGDTFDAFPAGRVRLADVNTPERGQPGYAEATEALRRLVEGKTVYLDVDNTNVIDLYNRIVCVVYVDYNATHVLNVNLWLVVNRHAVFYDFPNEFNPSQWSLYVRKN
ncbi:MAG: thermonuclease family protein [Candidatus Caldarchaeum sp.]|uniref:TNase-like domain-containing protein n=1 Tax=Caldiarchaeum subterraneum TaxID=311458 RepID=A0A7C5L8H8_CALS0